jgi:hypothetical protein
MAEMPLELLEEWRTLYDLEPWGEERTDLATGIAISHNAAVHGVESKPPAKYMHYIDPERYEPKGQAEDDMKKTWDAICKNRESQLPEGYDG